MRTILNRYLAMLAIGALILPVIAIYKLLMITDQRIGPPKVLEASCGNTTPIYLIVFDELSNELLMRKGVFDERLFPNFAALSKDAIWCRNATTNHWSTLDAIPTLLTGKIYPAEKHPTILELLPPEYHSTVMLSEIEVENWLRIRKGSRGVDRYAGKAHFLEIDPISAGSFLGYRLWSFFTFTLPQQIIFDDPEYHVTLFREQDSFSRSLEKRSMQFVLWHLSIPHSPFLFNANGERHDQTNTYFPFIEEYNPLGFKDILRNYKEQLRFADQMLGVIVKRLKETGIYDDAILIVTSDHGLRIWGNLFRHLDLTARIPLFIRIPSRDAAIIDRDIQLSDIVPTLVTALGCPQSKKDFDGADIFSNDKRPQTLHLGPSDITYTFDPVQKEWLRDASSLDKVQLAGNQWVTMKFPQKFSTVLAIDDVLLARETDQDFLTLYLARHFPKISTETDVAHLQGMLDTIKESVDLPGTNLKRGMYYFFLALTESRLISRGRLLDEKEVNQHWNSSLRYLRRTGDLQPLMAEEVQKVILLSDTNHDGILQSGELAALIKQRDAERYDEVAE